MCTSRGASPCVDCHGGNVNAEEFSEAHTAEYNFRAVKTPADVPNFCGRCHSDIEFMRKYKPSPRCDQAAEYWSSGHGKRLKEKNDPKVATCVSCHGNHGIKKVDDLASPVYATNVAKTCSKCHSDADRMKGYERHGQPLRTDQFDQWKSSVHGKAMLEKGDASAPTCNDCHGNHGAVPPEIGSVANACGSCHQRVAELFGSTRMKHKFEEAGLPGCATCHGNHGIQHPSDDNLGMETGAFCSRCHEDGKFGAPKIGADAAKGLRQNLENFKKDIKEAESMIDDAGRRGMEVQSARFEMAKAFDALTRARTVVHTFSPAAVSKTISEGDAVVKEVRAKAEGALEEWKMRRIWLGLSLVAISIFVGFLVFYIRTVTPVGPEGVPVDPGGDNDP